MQKSIPNKTNRPQRYSDVGHLAFITAEAMCGNVTDLERVSAHEAVNRPDSNEWITPMVDELKSLVENEVISVVEKSDDKKLLTAAGFLGWRNIREER